MYVIDTYVLMDIHDQKIPQDSINFSQCILLESTLAEFYGVLLREHGKQTAEYWFNLLKDITKPVDKETWKDAIYLKFNKTSNESLFDLLGYAYAINHNMKFMTGDKAFKGKKNVKFMS